MKYILSAIAAIAMVFSLAVPANGAVAFPSDWTCVSSCSVQYNATVGGNVLNVGIGGKATTQRFSGLGGTQICITYVSNGNAWPNLYNSSGINITFGVRSGWDTVCKAVNFVGQNLNLGVAGSTDKSILVRSVTVT